MKIMQKHNLPAVDHLVRNLVQGAHDQGLLSSDLQDVALSDIESGMLHEIREISLHDLAEGGGFQHAVPTGLRCLLRSGRTTSAAVDLDTGTVHDDGDVEIEGLVEGDQIRHVGQTLQRINAHSPSSGGDAGVLSLLRCRALNLEVLVMEPEGGGKPLVFPLLPGLAPLKERVYSELAFRKAIQPEARRVLAEYSRASGESLEG